MSSHITTGPRSGSSCPLCGYGEESDGFTPTREGFIMRTLLFLLCCGARSSLGFSGSGGLTLITCCVGLYIHSSLGLYKDYLFLIWVVGLLRHMVMVLMYISE